MSRIRPYMRAGDTIVYSLLKEAGSELPQIYQPESLMSQLRYYEDNSESFAQRPDPEDLGTIRSRFIDYVNESFPNEEEFRKKILDIGCGTGRDSKVFLSSSFHVTCMDASPAMLRKTRDYLNEDDHNKVSYEELTYDELDYIEYFNGIWATAAFVHLPPETIEAVINRCVTALKNGGILYLSVKYGEGNENYAGRRFYLYTEFKLQNIVAEIQNLNIIETFISNSEATELSGEVLEKNLRNPELRKKLFVNLICAKRM